MPRRSAVRAAFGPDPSRHLGDRGPRGAARATRLAMRRAAGRPLPVHPDPGPLVGRLSRQPGRASPVQLEAPARQSGQDVRHALRARGDRRPARRGARGLPRAPRSSDGRAAGARLRSTRTRCGNFTRAWTRVALGRGWLRFFLMRLDGRPVGAIYGFRYRGTFGVLPDGVRPRLCPPRHRAGHDGAQHQERHRGRSRRVRPPARHGALQVRLGRCTRELARIEALSAQPARPRPRASGALGRGGRPTCGTRGALRRMCAVEAMSAAGTPRVAQRWLRPRVAQALSWSRRRRA